MHRRKICSMFLMPALLFGLTACALSPIGSSSASAPAVSGTSASLEPEHLEFYDQFDSYNHMDSVDFFLSEIEHQGKLYYQFTSDTEEVTLLVSPYRKASYAHQAEVSYQGRTLTFDMPTFVLGYGAVSGHADLYLEDLTGDNTPELVYIYGGSGTDAWMDQVRVFDLAVMKECPINCDTSSLNNSVQLQLAGTRPSGLYSGVEAVYQLTTADGSTFYCGTGEQNTQEFPQSPPARFGDYEVIGLEDGTLFLDSSFWADLDNGIMGPYMGSLTGAFIYDPADCSFSLQPPFTLCVSQPVEDFC